MRRTALLSIGLLFAASLDAFANGGEIAINVVDPPGVGFNDPTPVDPVGGNPRETLGGQRLFVFEVAASIWEATLQPNVDVVIQASFAPLACSPTSGVLGAAGTIQIFANFANAEWPNTWYHSALANHLAQEDLTPGPPDPGLLQPPFNDDIVAFFNGDLGVNPDCLTGLTWYNGVDNEAPSNAIDLLNVVLHEFAHGLGFANFVDDSTGNAVAGFGDVYSVFTYDATQGLYWNQMDKRQRSASAVNTGEVTWRGPEVTADVPNVLAGRTVVRTDLFGDFPAQPASYGAPVPPPPGLTADVVPYDDGVGPDPNDACDIVLDPNVAGKIALIRRGTCAFALKSALAQLSGAVGVIITNNQPSGLPPMGGTDLVDPLIPSVGISRDDGDALRPNLPVEATLVADPALGFAGADDAGFAKLYAPDPVEPGSSISHWDTTLTPNALMEPFINSDLKGATTLDLTPAQMRDIGWDRELSCPVGSDDRDTVEVGACSTGVFNQRGPFAFSGGQRGRPNGNAYGVDAMGGCYIQDMINACERQGSAGQVASCVAETADYLRKAGVLSRRQADDLKACASN